MAGGRAGRPRPGSARASAVGVALVGVLAVGACAGAPSAGQGGGAACAKLTEQELMDSAEVVFRGQALDGEKENGALLSPAQFRVTEYIKGSGPDQLGVQTGQFRGAASSEGIRAAPGEMWLIYAI